VCPKCIIPNIITSTYSYFNHNIFIWIGNFFPSLILFKKKNKKPKTNTYIQILYIHNAWRTFWKNEKKNIICRVWYIWKVYKKVYNFPTLCWKNKLEKKPLFYLYLQRFITKQRTYEECCMFYLLTLITDTTY
jgi:hypothetical protein